MKGKIIIKNNFILISIKKLNLINKIYNIFNFIYTDIKKRKILLNKK